jgi:hypothetical protein
LRVCAARPDRQRPDGRNDGRQRLPETGIEHLMRIVAVAGSLAFATAGPLQPVPSNG